MINGADTAWLLTSSALVLLMTLPALGFFYAGLVQAKNILSVLFQCVGIAALVSLLWFAFVYSETFSGGGGLIGDASNLFLSGIGRGAVRPGTHIPESVFVMFQMTFAIIAPALIIGAYAERIRFSAAMVFSGLWLVIVYAPVAHWMWGGGFLQTAGALDFAGGIVVHLTAGLSAIVVAWLLGPRQDFPHSINPPHAPWMVMVGASLLWVGWFGFNAGSALSSGADAGMTMLATHLAAATATLVWVAIEWIKYGKPSLVGAVTGTVAGLATITPASGYVGPAGAVALGVAGGLVCYGAVILVKHTFKIDDALDVLGVHGVGGTLGSLLLPFVAAIGNGGAVMARPILEQAAIQGKAVLVCGVWTLAATFAIVKLAGIFVPMRANRDAEIQGLDFSYHGETGYHADN
jgi:Amt family ammonium transporter